MDESGTHTKEGGLDMSERQDGVRIDRHHDVQTIGDRVVINPRFRLAALRDVDGNVIDTVRLSLEVCGCGYSLARPGVGYAGAAGWYCKRCGQLHTLDESKAGSAPDDSAHLESDPSQVREFDQRFRVSHEWPTASDLEAIQ